MIPIIERLEDAPETGDCWLKQRGIGASEYLPVRNRQLGFVVTSKGGWNTSAKQFRRVTDFGLEWCDGVFTDVVFAPTAEDAIHAYHADPEKCPFGEVTLRKTKSQGGAYFEFVGKHGVFLSQQFIIFDSRHVYRFKECFAVELVALHALEGEVIAYHKAFAAGRPEQSAIGRELAQRGSDVNKA